MKILKLFTCKYTRVSLTFLSLAGTEASSNSTCSGASSHQRSPSPGLNTVAESQQESPSSGAAIGLEGVHLEEDPELSLSFEGYAAELRQCQTRMRKGSTTKNAIADPAHLHDNPPSEGASATAGEDKEDSSAGCTYKATFVWHGHLTNDLINDLGYLTYVLSFLSIQTKQVDMSYAQVVAIQTGLCLQPGSNSKQYSSKTISKI